MSKVRKDMLSTIKNAISIVKGSKAFDDVDQSMKTVAIDLLSCSKEIISNLINIVSFTEGFLLRANELKRLYQKGPHSTYNMLNNILETKPTVDSLTKDILILISSQHSIEEFINNYLENDEMTLSQKKTNVLDKLVNLSSYIDTSISNVGCFIISTVSTIDIGETTMKSLSSGRVVLRDENPRAMALRDAVNIVKYLSNIQNKYNTVSYPPISNYNTFKSDNYDDNDEDSGRSVKKDENLNAIPNLSVPMTKKIRNKGQSLGIIIVHPNKQIEYNEVTNKRQFKRFVRNNMKKYEFQIKDNPNFSKAINSKGINTLVNNIKEKADRNGMSKKEMVDEILNNLNNNY